MRKFYLVYIIASRRNGTLYIGVTNDLVFRVWQNREGQRKGFTKRYGVNRLVHYEVFDDVMAAIRRETALKKWKLELIEKNNLAWEDLHEKFTKPALPEWLVQAKAMSLTSTRRH